MNDLEEIPCLLCGREGIPEHLRSRVQLSPATGEWFGFRKCPDCDLVFLSPRPTLAGMARYYPPDYLPFRGASAWGRWAPLVERAERGMDRRRVRTVLRRRRLDASASVLDVGCGRPTFLRTLRAATGARCVGVDPSDEGWRSGGPAWDGLRLLRGTAEELRGSLRKISGGGFQVITLWHALEHEGDPRGLLRILRGLAAPAARLVVEVPDLDSLPARRQGGEWGGLHTPRHTAAYTPATLAGMLAAGGWEVEAHFRHGTLDPWPLWWLGVQARRDRSLAGPLESAFPGFVAGKVAALPLTLLQRWIPLGIQLAVARPVSLDPTSR
jgi:SAM-dependent methyltransferase